MAFDVSYIFTAKNRYTAVAGKIAASNRKIKGSAIAAAHAIKSKLNTSIGRLNTVGLKAKHRMKALNTEMEGFIFIAKGVRNAGLAMTAVITLPLLLAGRSALKLASDAEETRSKFATVFKGLGDGAETTADSFAKNFGLAGTTARKLLGDTGDLLSGFGFTQEKALGLSNKVNELAVDLASFTNLSGGAEGASAALNKALLGERESLKSLGIAISEKMVKAKVALMVSQGSKFASMQEAKAEATFAIAVDQSKNSIGDYARTKEAAANVSRLLGQRTIELKEKYGKLLLPMQVKVNNALIGMIDKLNSLSPAMKKTILVVAGVLAVAGPLLLMLGSVALILPVIAAGFGLISLPVLAVVAAIGAAVAAFIWLQNNWVAVSDVIGGTIEQIGINFSLLWKGIKDGFKSFIAFFMPAIDAMLFPIKKLMQFRSFVRGKAFDAFGGVSPAVAAPAVAAPVLASPAVATANARATVNGNITVSATEGSRVDSVESQQVFSGAQGNVGLGVAA